MNAADATFVRSPASARGASFGALVVADWRRIQRTWILPLTVMGPVGVTLMGVILFLLRGEYMLAGFDPSSGKGFVLLFDQMGLIQVFALGLGATLLASMIVDVEHRSDTWKSAFALPLRRWKVYLVKFAWCVGLLAVASALMGLGYAALMQWQHLGEIPWADIARAAAYPFVAVLPLLAFQLLVSTTMKNQALPLALGIVTPLFGLGMSGMPAWLPWRLPTQGLVLAAGGVSPGMPGEVLQWLTPSTLGAVSAASVAVLVVLGAVMLSRKEIR